MDENKVIANGKLSDGPHFYPDHCSNSHLFAMIVFLCLILFSVGSELYLLLDPRMANWEQMVMVIFVVSVPIFSIAAGFAFAEYVQCQFKKEMEKFMSED